ncbi:tail protein X [Piscirickettsia salmonis]|uniref:tail protein X n=1 Tax=Piscirickettsia salmonis TaxID=1238 RepID=UPI003EB7F438
MAQIYNSQDNDVVDSICYRYYGDRTDALDLVFTANPTLPTYGTHLPAGLIITLPHLPTAETAETIQLFD